MKHTTHGNPYTHAEYTRTTYQTRDLLYGYGLCTWCGNSRRTLYRYNDSEPIQLMGQTVAAPSVTGHAVNLYCNKSCYNANER